MRGNIYNLITRNYPKGSKLINLNDIVNEEF